MSTANLRGGQEAGKDNGGPARETSQRRAESTIKNEKNHDNDEAVKELFNGKLDSGVTMRILWDFYAECLSVFLQGANVEGS